MPVFPIAQRASIMLVKAGCTGTKILGQLDEQTPLEAVKGIEPLAVNSAPNPMQEGALPSLALGEGDFFASPTIRQLAEEQGVEPLQSIHALGGVFPEEEANDFP